MDFFTLQDFRRDPQVADPAVGAAPDDRLVDFNFTHLTDGFGIRRQVRHRNLRLHLGHVPFNNFSEFGVGVLFRKPCTDGWHAV